jgi:hypothetical protein
MRAFRLDVAENLSQVRSVEQPIPDRSQLFAIHSLFAYYGETNIDSVTL